MIYPNVIIAGAPKCGTSSLYFWLAAHPEVCASKQKETFYFADSVNRFNKSANFIEHGLSKYSSHFNHCNGSKIVFEATAPYIYFDNAITEIPKLPTNPKVIFILRNPEKRLLSQYLFEKYRTQRVNGSFEEYIKEKGVLDHGNYIHYINRWVDKLGKENVHILILEEMLKDLPSAMSSLAKELGIDPSFYKNFDFTVRNETVKIKKKWLHQFGLKVQKNIPHKVQEFLLPLYLKINSGGKPTASPEDIEMMNRSISGFYDQNNQELFSFLGREIPSWKNI